MPEAPEQPWHISLDDMPVGTAAPACSHPSRALRCLPHPGAGALDPHCHPLVQGTLRLSEGETNLSQNTSPCCGRAGSQTQAV